MKTNNTRVDIVSGKEVTKADLELINKYRKIRLNRTSIWDHNINTGFEERTFFLVKDSGELVSFGTLRPVKIYIDNKEYEILGLQAVISIMQGKGYGKILMHSIKDYAEEENKTVIGFCERKNSEFYRKSGFNVWENGNWNFIYIDTNGNEQAAEGDVVYYSKNQNFIKTIQKGNLYVKHFIPHW